MFRTLITILAIVLMTGCASVRNDGSGDPARLTQYKRAYIVRPPSDEFGIYRALHWELRDLGFVVLASKPAQPAAGDLDVSFNYEGAWDFSRYLQSFQLDFVDATTSEMILTHSYYSRGVWRGVRDQRLEEAFNSIRASIGKPPTKQFAGQ